jgi:hypothetical protein
VTTIMSSGQVVDDGARRMVLVMEDGDGVVRHHGCVCVRVRVR